MCVRKAAQMCFRATPLLRRGASGRPLCAMLLQGVRRLTCQPTSGWAKRYRALNYWRAFNRASISRRGARPGLDPGWTRDALWAASNTSLWLPLYPGELENGKVIDPWNPNRDAQREIGSALHTAVCH